MSAGLGGGTIGDERNGGGEGGVSVWEGTLGRWGASRCVDWAGDAGGLLMLLLPMKEDMAQRVPPWVLQHSVASTRFFCTFPEVLLKDAVHCARLLTIPSARLLLLIKLPVGNLEIAPFCCHGAGHRAPHGPPAAPLWPTRCPYVLLLAPRRMPTCTNPSIPLLLSFFWCDINREASWEQQGGVTLEEPKRMADDIWLCRSSDMFRV
eukprot:326711-Pelagomonas_calceolata.AAC.1